MKLTIAGAGVVGNAHKDFFTKKCALRIVDPKINDLKVDAKTDGLIVCVDTPSMPDGSCDYSNIYNVLSEAPKVPILIKSTIDMRTWEVIQANFSDLIISYSPEFLRAETASQDLLVARELLIGGGLVKFWGSMFNKKVVEATVEELIVAKYARNSFLATKVSFFNQIYDYCEKSNIDYKKVAELTGLDSRIGDSHTEVTEERGWGGHCFPKDVRAFIKMTGGMSILNHITDYNNKIR